MKFPYGVSDFDALITRRFHYVDRTDQIPLSEEAGDQLLFLRPRRFGKSLLLFMLESYYDLNKSGRFGQLFGGLAIPSATIPPLGIIDTSFSNGISPRSARWATVKRSSRIFIR